LNRFNIQNKARKLARIVTTKKRQPGFLGLAACIEFHTKGR
jgi:hypothetical protein